MGGPSRTAVVGGCQAENGGIALSGSAQPPLTAASPRRDIVVAMSTPSRRPQDRIRRTRRAVAIGTAATLASAWLAVAGLGRGTTPTASAAVGTVPEAAPVSGDDEITATPTTTTTAAPEGSAAVTTTAAAPAAVLPQPSLPAATTSQS